MGETTLSSKKVEREFLDALLASGVTLKHMSTVMRSPYHMGRIGKTIRNCATDVRNR